MAAPGSLSHGLGSRCSPRRTNPTQISRRAPNQSRRRQAAGDDRQPGEPGVTWQHPRCLQEPAQHRPRPGYTPALAPSVRHGHAPPRDIRHQLLGDRHQSPEPSLCRQCGPCLPDTLGACQWQAAAGSKGLIRIFGEHKKRSRVVI